MANKIDAERQGTVTSSIASQPHLYCMIRSTTMIHVYALSFSQGRSLISTLFVSISCGRLCFGHPSDHNCSHSANDLISTTATSFSASSASPENGHVQAPSLRSPLLTSYLVQLDRLVVAVYARVARLVLEPFYCMRLESGLCWGLSVLGYLFHSSRGVEFSLRIVR